MIKLFAKTSLLFLPLAILIGIYIAMDPFKVVFKYEFGDYYKGQPWELNRTYVSTEKLLTYYQRQEYDSFIFGISRSLPFLCGHWKQFLSPEASPFHYTGAGEGLSRAHLKMKFIDSQGISLKNALWIIDSPALADVSFPEDVVRRSHYKLSGESWISFQSFFFRASFSNFFLVKALDYHFFRTLRPYMAGTIAPYLSETGIDPLSNDYYFSNERELVKGEDAYYRQSEKYFPSGKPYLSEFPPAIGNKQSEYLLNIKKIFEKHGTKFRIVIVPWFPAVRTALSDVETLRKVFGDASVFDFSGRNEISGNIRNFYDSTHLRPHAADEVMQQVYSKGVRSQREVSSEGD